MQRSNRWVIIGMIIVGLQLSACAQAAAPEAAETEHIRIETVAETGQKREILSEEAVQRLGIETVATVKVPVVKSRLVGGEVIEQANADSSAAYVRVGLSQGDFDTVDQSQSALILPLDSIDGAQGLAAELAEAPTAYDPKDADESLYYKVDNSALSLTTKERVYVELVLKGSGEQHVVVPYSAILYDTTGATWVYVNTEPLTFVRTSVTVDYIDGDKAILLDGPPADTMVVTVGAEELFGAESEFAEE